MVPRDKNEPTRTGVGKHLVLVQCVWECQGFKHVGGRMVFHFIISGVVIEFWGSKTQPNNIQLFETGKPEVELSFLTEPCEGGVPGTGSQLALAVRSS